MVANDVILRERRDAIVLLSLNEPERSNVLNHGLASRLIPIVNEIALDDSVRVVVIMATGNTFCRGSSEDVAPYDLSDAKLGIGADSRAVQEVAALSVPAIAAIQGDAAGSGLELALACDFRVVADGARLSLPQVRHGRIPNAGGTQRLPRLIGRTRALEMILWGEEVGAREAERIGLCSKVSPPDRVVADALELAARIAALAPIALRYAKQAIWGGIDLSLAEAMQLEMDLSVLLHSTRDRAAGLKAFRERTVPEFRAE